MGLALIWLHVSGNLIWIGAIVAVGFVLAGREGFDGKTRGRMAYDIYRRLAVPAFIVSFLCGAIRLGLDADLYMRQTHWMHAKLPLALGVIALHHVIGGRAKRTASGSVTDGGPAGILTVLLALAAAGAAFFAIFKIPR